MDACIRGSVVDVNCALYALLMDGNGLLVEKIATDEAFLALSLLLRVVCITADDK